MRSVLAFLRNATESEVEVYLNASYPSQRDPWVVRVDGDPCLYIWFYHDGPREHEPDEWADILRRFAGEPAASVIAFVSGRHAGDKQVADFVAGILTRFDGAAMDEHTTHLWSLTETQSGRRFLGHPFFDYQGWFDESERP